MIKVAMMWMRTLIVMSLMQTRMFMAIAIMITFMIMRTTMLVRYGDGEYTIVGDSHRNCIYIYI